MSQILITSDELNEVAARVEGLRGEVESIFSQIRVQMGQVQSVWQSPAGNRAWAQFEQLSPYFEQYTQLIENYCVYLRQTATAYQENESMLSGD